MQKAIIVRSVLDGSRSHSWSDEVDGLQTQENLRDLLTDGWRVVHTCPLASELDPCCLVIVEKATLPRQSVTGNESLADFVDVHDWLDSQLPPGADSNLRLLDPARS